MMTLRTILISTIGLISYQFAIAGPAAVSAADTSAPQPRETNLTVQKYTEETSDPAEETDSLAGYDVTELDDFVIVQRKKLLESDGAKLTYNVTEDPEAGSSNIIDILRKVPGVSVDAEDNVKVNGQSSFKILMNGQENPMLKGDLKTVLKSIPAASIKKIEVISEPGAKYEAEGVGGILNIITDKKTDLSGFMTQLGAWVNSYQAGGYVNGRTKIRNVMLDGYINYNDGNAWPRAYHQTQENEFFNEQGNPTGKLTSRKRRKSGWDYTGGTINMSWEPDTLNLFTLSGNYGYNTWGGHGTETRTMHDSAMAEMWSLTRKIHDKGRYSGGGVQASYQHTFGKEGHNLIASYEFDYAGQHMDEDSQSELIEGEEGEPPYTGTKSGGNDVSHIFQLDYALPLTQKHLLEAGAKFNLNYTKRDNDSYFGADPENAICNETFASSVKQFKDIYAIYASYTGTFDKWSAKAGLRYEFTRMGLEYRKGDHQDFSTKLNDIVPNAAVSYNFTDASSLRMAYQMRISRPGLWSLNPWRDTTTPGEVSYGNPDLKSQKSHNISLTYSNYEGKFGGNAQLTYNYSANGINDIIFMENGLINQTYANIGKSHMASLWFQGNWNILSSLRWSLNAGGTYEYMKADSELMRAKNCGWQFNLNTDISYTAPCKLRLSGYGGFYTPWIDLQSRGSNGYYYGLGLSRSFLKDDALTVSVNASNLLPYKRTNRYEQQSESVRLTNTYTQKWWNVGMSVTWKFGGLKASVKKTAANIEKESEGSKGGGPGGK